MEQKKIYYLTLVLFLVIITSFYHVQAYQNNLNYNYEKQSTLISISKSQITDEYIRENVRPSSLLLDEQNKLPNTPIPLTKNVSISMSGQQTWMPGFNGKNVQAFINLNGIYKITQIGYFDGPGVVDLTFSEGSPFKWSNVATIKTSSYNEWKIIDINNIETQYLRIETLSGTNSGISEIALYGYKVANIESSNPNIDLSNPDFGITVDKAVGANAFIDDPIDVLKATGVIREYHNFHWTLDNLGLNKFNPSYGGKWNFDNYYKNLFDSGILAFPCIQGVSKNVLGVSNTNNKPVLSGSNTLDPLSYKIHSSTMYQYAARYGSSVVNDNNLLLSSDQTKISGLGYLSYYENWNEQDKTWEGDDSYFSPYEYAAMTSADYDGHEKALGNTYGIKNADLNSKLVMGGLASGQNAPKYLDLMKLWFENNRKDKKLAFDVINFHTYCGNKSPEESNFKNIITSVTTWRNTYSRDKEVWLTEYGWDSTLQSPISAPNNLTQRDWLIRSSLIALSSGIDRMTMYMSRDASWVGNPGKYATSGLTTEKGAWTKKPSWYGMYTLKETLKGFEFDHIVQEDDKLYIYKFINKTTKQDCYALWSPTSNGSSILNYEFNVGDKTKPVLTNLEDGYYDGQKEKLHIDNNKVKFNISESPIFLTLSPKETSYIVPTNKKIPITSNMISVPNLNKPEDTKKLLNNYNALFDEQSHVTQAPLVKSLYNFTTRFDSNLTNNYYPLEGYIDLGQEYYISHIGLYDSNSVGNIAFFAGKPGNWSNSPFYKYDLSTYNNWVVNEAKIKTRYLKIVKYDSAYLNEIGLYGYSAADEQYDPNYLINQIKDFSFTSKAYNLTNSYISNIPEYTTVKELKNNCLTNGEIIVKDSDGYSLQDNDLIGSNMLLIVTYGDKILNYKTVVNFDLDGNGKVTVTDLSRMKQALVGFIQLNDSFLQASDYDKNGFISVTDLSSLNRYLINYKK